MRIQHNVMALNSYNRLATNNNNLSKNLEKLSSGYKINRAADNAAGLAISEKMRAQITGLETCQQNAKDGISLVQTAEGALTEVHSMLNRMVALTTQASNGIYEDGERQKIQDELDQLNEEIDRIADATNFNGIKLLDGTMGSKKSAGGASAKSVIDTNLTTTYVDPVAGSFTSGAAFSNTNLDGVGAKGTYQINFDDGTSFDVEIEVVSGGGNNLALKVNGEDFDGFTPAATVTAQAVGDAIAKALTDKFGDTYTVDSTATAGKLTITANEAGTGTARVTGISVSGMKKDGITGWNEAITGANFATAGTAPVVGTNTINAANATEEVLFTDFTVYDGTNLDTAMFEINGNKFIIAQNTTDVSKLDSDINVITISAATLGAQTQKDELKQQLSQALGMDIKTDSATAGTKLIFSGDGPKKSSGLRLQIGDTNDEFNMLDVTVDDCHADAIGVGTAKMRVDDVDTANQAMMAAKDAIEYVSKVRSNLGAIQNRLDHTLNNLQETTTNLTDAESRIRDTDMAEEMMKYTKNNILIQSSQAMLAQANQVPQGVLQLLQ